MKTITLTRGYSCIVDEHDYDIQNKYKWLATNTRKDTDIIYAVRFTRIDGKFRAILMHRDIMGLSFNDPHEIDHKDGDGLNNLRINIRIATTEQNLFNKKRYKNNKSGYKGVRLVSKGNYQAWRCEISFRGKHINLGCFQDIEEAATAYNIAAVELFGEFARLNEV